MLIRRERRLWGEAVIECQPVIMLVVGGGRQRRTTMSASEHTPFSVMLRHYRLADPKQPMINGPNLASFDPKQNARFLLFLHRETDGRYSPVSGQTDPTLFSVLRLEGVAQ